MYKLNKKQIFTLGYNYAMFVCGDREKLKPSLKKVFTIYKQNYELPKKIKTHIDFLDSYIAICDLGKENGMVNLNPFIRDSKEYFIFNEGVYKSMVYMLQVNKQINENNDEYLDHFEFEHEYELYRQLSKYCDNAKKDRLLKKYSEGIGAMSELIVLIQNERSSEGYPYVFDEDYKIIKDRYFKGNKLFSV